MYIDHLHIMPESGPHVEQVRRDFFYTRVVQKNNEEFETLSPESELREEISELIDNKRRQISNNLEDFGEPLTTVAQNVFVPQHEVAFRPERIHGDTSDNTVKYTGDVTKGPILLLLLDEEIRHPRWREQRRDSPDLLRICIIAKSRDDGESFLGWFINEMNEIETYVGEFAEIKQLIKGGEIVHHYFNAKVAKNPNLEDWYQDDFQNDFEEKVYKEIRDISGVTLSNVRIQADFGDNPDFDTVVLPLGGLGTNYAVEVKNYSQESNPEVEEPPSANLESGELRSELIRKPKDFAEQAGLNLISIVKGLSDDQYDNLHKLAESSNVILLNDENYLNNIEDLIFKHNFESAKEFIR